MYYSPLRYPGGKRRLANYVKLILLKNGLVGGDYAEIYAGGAAVALELLFSDFVKAVHINEFDRGVYAFWDSVVNNNDALCRRIMEVDVSMEEWERQKAVLVEKDADPMDLAVATFYLNRTNRSGIISGGVIGGKMQNGPWRMDARFNKANLVKRISKIGKHRSQIHVYNLDAIDFIKQTDEIVVPNSLIYLDPPYWVKGKVLLYTNGYQEDDHHLLAKCMEAYKYKWIVSYDFVTPILELYRPFRSVAYDINYTAQRKELGMEILYFSHGLKIPSVEHPLKVSRATVERELDPEYILGLDTRNEDNGCKIK